MGVCLRGPDKDRTMGESFMVTFLPKSIYDIADWLEEKLTEDTRKNISKFCIYMGAGIITGTFILILLGVIA